VYGHFSTVERDRAVRKEVQERKGEEKGRRLKRRGKEFVGQYWPSCCVAYATKVKRGGKRGGNQEGKGQSRDCGIEGRVT